MKVPADFGVDDSALVEMAVANDVYSARASELSILRELARCGYTADITFGIKLALEEALANAIKHGNGNDAAKRIVLRYHVDSERTIIMVRDEGRGFCPDALPDPTAEENLERPYGRGIMLMQSYMTKVRFNEAANEVWMLKEKLDRMP